MKLRILHVITRLPVGGAERLLVDIVRRLDPDLYESVVCCIQKTGELAAEVQTAGIPLFCLYRMRSRRFDWRAVIELTRLIRRERIGLVHSHLYHANLYARLAAFRAGVPAVASVHNTYTRPKLHRRLINLLLSRVGARVVAGSDDVRRDLIRYDGVRADKIVTIYNGIDVARIETQVTRRQARERLGISDQALAIGCIARLEEQKGHRFLLEALALLNQEPNLASRLKLILVGDGRLRKALEEQAAALGVTPWTTFLGTRQDLAEILKALDVYVMPSLWEGLSLAMLEAMSATLPIVASDVGGVSQVIGNDEYGIRVPPGDAAALARAIRALIDDPQRRAALGMRARERVIAKFNIGAMMQVLTRVYEDVRYGEN